MRRQVVALPTALTSVGNLNPPVVPPYVLQLDSLERSIQYDIGRIPAPRSTTVAGAYPDHGGGRYRSGDDHRGIEARRKPRLQPAVGHPPLGRLHVDLRHHGGAGGDREPRIAPLRAGTALRPVAGRLGGYLGLH